MLRFIPFFKANERGAISVDYVVLSAAAVAMSIAATDVIRAGQRVLTSDMEAQLRSQNISDSFVEFTSTHFDPLYDAGMLTEEQAETLFNSANNMMNADILDTLEDGIYKMNEGTITEAELTELYAVASVAYQRNIVDADVIETYFGTDSQYYAASN
ncbi:hypothetical protein HKCCE3408_17410 [Rhodobacterales bacterium HKCCE3408]|nr:hypothetical protein [Rhodobacterales bacterium HKCCE3408]